VFYCYSTSPVIRGIQTGTESDMDLFRGRKLITLGFDQSYLPRLTLFTAGKAVTALEALNARVHQSNQNLSLTQIPVMCASVGSTDIHNIHSHYLLHVAT